MDGNLAPRRPGLVLLSGLPGTGKTTFARVLAERLAALHLESDAVRRDLVPVPTYQPAEHAAVFGRLERRAEAALLDRRHVVVDATNVDGRDRRRFVRLATRVDAILVPVRLTAPEATIRMRLGRPREGLSEAGIDVYEAMRGRAQPFARPAIVVDSRYDPGAAVDLVSRLLHDRAE